MHLCEYRDVYSGCYTNNEYYQMLDTEQFPAIEEHGTYSGVSGRYLPWQPSDEGPLHYSPATIASRTTRARNHRVHNLFVSPTFIFRSDSRVGVGAFLNKAFSLYYHSTRGHRHTMTRGPQ